MSLTAIIVDDEPDAHKLLLHYCNKHGGIDIKAHFYDAMATWDFLQGNKVDVLFLDINMPAMSGLQLASMIGGTVQVIFTTAHSQHALEGYEYNTVDYLLKPIKYERFAKALSKLRNVDSPAPADIPIQLSGMTEPLMATEVHYVEAMGNYLKLHLTKKVVIVHETMKHLEQLLKPHGFLRCHKTFIVQLAQVEGLDNDYCILKNGKAVAIGISYRQQVKAALHGRQIL